MKAPGRAHREGITLIKLAELFPDEDTAAKWFEERRWPNGRTCPHCGSEKTKEMKSRKPMAFHCGGCRKFFSVRTGTVMAESKIPLRKWAFAIYLWATSLKGVSSMKLYRDLGITQKSAWFMAHRLRQAWESDGGVFGGPVEVDETYVGGRESNKHEKKKLKAGRGGVGKAVVIGMRDRASGEVKAKVISDTKATTLKGFVRSNVKPDTRVYTDDHAGYRGFPQHEVVKHSVGEYVRDQAHTNGMESFWSLLKRAYHGTFHHISPRHLDRYVGEFAGRQNMRDLDTLALMGAIWSGLIGRRLRYSELIS